MSRRNLFLNREPRRFGLIDAARMKREATGILADFGVHVDVSAPLRTLGVGAQQMVALARAVQIDARVVIMDEPTSSLEQREVQTLFGVIARLKEAGIGIVYVSHRLDELYQVCDRVTVMRDGRVVQGRRPRRSGQAPAGLADAGPATRPKSPAAVHGGEIAGEPVLVAHDVSVRHEIDDVSLQLRPGEVVGLGGLLGAGRTETARALAGASALDAGEVDVLGTRVHPGSTAAAIRAGIVMLPEDRKSDGILPNLSVRENIVLAALSRVSRGGVMSAAKQDEIVRYYTDRLRIKAYSPEQKVGELSGGNQQKVMLARWLCLNPKVLLLDEPTRGIDVGAKAEVQNLINELAGDGLAVLLISSELDELIQNSIRVVVLKDGRVVGDLTGAEVNESALIRMLAGDGQRGADRDQVAGTDSQQRDEAVEAADGDRTDPGDGS